MDIINEYQLKIYTIYQRYQFNSTNNQFSKNCRNLIFPAKTLDVHTRHRLISSTHPVYVCVLVIKLKR